jgi:hypothetical protein
MASAEAPEDAGPRKCGQSEAISDGEPALSAMIMEIVKRAENAAERPREKRVRLERMGGDRWRWKF